MAQSRCLCTLSRRRRFGLLLFLGVMLAIELFCPVFKSLGFVLSPPRQSQDSNVATHAVASCLSLFGMANPAHAGEGLAMTASDFGTQNTLLLILVVLGAPIALFTSKYGTPAEPDKDAKY
eukprot:TRINITY_DN110380_c0_g1_i1.p1 TRINITY_DN110380_c0_g1~~TRINITY_DN110380_c0_g1_i1.p1  ORF type:complete len:121 (+),score=17.65 TRINITY_DN110380_c0_g1_i1:56-418(+)